MKVAKIIKETQVEGKYGPQTRTAFTVEGDERILSTFSKYPIKVGQELEGEITSIEKDGKTYHNFAFAKKSGDGFANQAILTRLQGIEVKLNVLLERSNPKRNILSDGSPMPFPDDDPFKDVFPAE